MKKIKLYGETLKEQLLAGAKDRLYRFILADGKIRGVILHGTRMVNEMRWNHELGILETLVLGHAYIGAALMSSGLKGNDRLSIQVECSGPIKGFVVESNAFGDVRGFLKNVPIPVEKPLESFNLSPFFGAGFLSVTKYLEGAKQPFTGKVMLDYGSLAKDLALYHMKSEQTPSSFSLSICFDKNGDVSGAGGLFLQAMPGAEDEVVNKIEDQVSTLPSIGDAFSSGVLPKDLINEYFSTYSPQFLTDIRVEFMCHCNHRQLENVLAMLPIHDIKEIMDNGPFPVVMRCHHCNTRYTFEKTEIEMIYKRRSIENPNEK